MPSFFDSSRRRTAEWPCFVGTDVALPVLELTPDETDSEWFFVRVWLLSEDSRAFSFSAKERRFRVSDLSHLLARYRSDPEETLKDLFGWGGKMSEQRAEPSKPESVDDALAKLGL